jgi:hypothetical protein
LKNDLTELQKFEMKYGFEDPELVNNFLHRNSFKFGRYFELKFGEVKVFYIETPSDSKGILN